MNKGYTIEVIRRDLLRSLMYHFKTEEEARLFMSTKLKNYFCILTEWAHFDDFIGDYEVEIERQNY